MSAFKGASGNKSVGYDVYDTYNLGEFDQKGSVATKYGTRDEYLNAVHVLQENKIEVITDIFTGTHHISAAPILMNRQKKTAFYVLQVKNGEKTQILRKATSTF